MDLCYKLSSDLTDHHTFDFRSAIFLSHIILNIKDPRRFLKDAFSLSSAFENAADNYTENSAPFKSPLHRQVVRERLTTWSIRPLIVTLENNLKNLVMVTSRT